MIPAWVEATKDGEIPTGLSVDEALQRALELRHRLREGTVSRSESYLDSESVEALHALCALLDQGEDEDPKRLLADASAAFEFVSAIDWPREKFGGPSDICSKLAFMCWRYARQAEVSIAESKWWATHSAIASSRTRLGAERTLATPMEQRLERSGELGLEDPEQLLSICSLLWEMCEAEPASVRNEAAFFFAFLGSARLRDSDEREYYLGELALIAGGTCRLLSKRDESKRWFDLAESKFVLARNASKHIARLDYQRLALRLEERDLDAVAALAPKSFDRLVRLGLQEDALKCRFLEAHALKECGQLEKAKRVFEDIRGLARRQGFVRLSALASENLFQIHSFLGEVEEAVVAANEAAPVLQGLNNRVGLAKLQAGVGYLMRAQGRIEESIAAFREAQRQFSEIQMAADVAATHLVIAELLLDAADTLQAEREISAALPVIEELRLMPEGIAALSLLRESLRRRKIDRQALRDLHNHFQNKKPD